MSLQSSWAEHGSFFIFLGRKSKNNPSRQVGPKRKSFFLQTPIKTVGSEPSDIWAAAQSLHQRLILSIHNIKPYIFFLFFSLFACFFYIATATTTCRPVRNMAFHMSLNLFGRLKSADHITWASKLDMFQNMQEQGRNFTVYSENINYEYICLGPKLLLHSLTTYIWLIFVMCVFKYLYTCS